MDISYTEADTAAIAQHILSAINASPNRATVVGLTGDLGAGKTTLVKALAETLNVKETVVSPTFVIAKFYDMDGQWNQLVHIDAYRIEAESELVPLGWSEMLARPQTLIIVEWPERIRESLPADTVFFAIDHDGGARRIRKV